MYRHLPCCISHDGDWAVNVQLQQSSLLLHGTHPHCDHLRILFSNIYVKHMQKSKRSGTPQQATRYKFGGFHGTSRVKLYITDNDGVRYAHHASIDEQQLDTEPKDRNPAGRLLSQLPDAVPCREELRKSIDELDLSPKRWKDGSLQAYEVSSLCNDGTMGLLLEFDKGVYRCKIKEVIKNTPMASVVSVSEVRNNYLLELNGCAVCTIEDVNKLTTKMTKLGICSSGFSIFLALRGV